jgi:urease accessory protein
MLDPLPVQLPEQFSEQFSDQALETTALLRLLQLASSSLPVGAYSYSEGLEFLVEQGRIKTDADLALWLRQDFYYGAIQLELGVMVALNAHDTTHKITDEITEKITDEITHWNAWLSAAKETAELQQQSWQMGGSLVRLFNQLEPDSPLAHCSLPLNFAIAYSTAAAYWQIPLSMALLGYAQSWASNLISAGIKLIPLGQTQGQQLLAQLHPDILTVCRQLLASAPRGQSPPRFRTCGWGLALASMGHETQYSRLFRS